MTFIYQSVHLAPCFFLRHNRLPLATIVKKREKKKKKKTGCNLSHGSQAAETHSADVDFVLAHCRAWATWKTVLTRCQPVFPSRQRRARPWSENELRGILLPFQTGFNLVRKRTRKLYSPMDDER